MDRNCCRMRRVKVEDRSFHTHRAYQSAFETIIAKVFDEGRQVVFPQLRLPDDGFAVCSGDRGEGSPFVSG